MTIQRMEHVGIVVDDLAAATEFFVELGLELQGEGSVEGRWVDRVVGLDGVQMEYAMVQIPRRPDLLQTCSDATPQLPLEMEKVLISREVLFLPGPLADNWQ
jgi:catechol 2,3-dioxygenase-like lactoylglutathione lyase family enzyme